MPEGEIQILIKAQDQASATLKKIEAQLQIMADNSKKQTEQIEKGFTSTTDSLIAVGNAASSVDSIFSSLQNLELRLENATERVANATDRLSDAQTKLNRLQKSGKASAEDLADAQKEVDRATRGLTISQNNLSRAQNQVIGTYINIGLQSLKLIQSFPQLTAAIHSMTAASLTFIATPLGATLLAVGVAVAAFVEHSQKIKKIAEAQAEVAERTKEVELAQQRVNDKYNEQYESIVKIQGLITGAISKKSTEELDLIAQIKEQELERWRAQQEGRDREASLIERSIESDKEKLRGFELEREAKQSLSEATVQIKTDELDVLSGLNKQENDLKIMSYEEFATWLATEYKTMILTTAQEIADEEIRIANEKADAEIAAKQRVIDMEKKRTVRIGSIGGREISRALKRELANKESI